MDRLAESRQSGFLDRLRHGRMGVAGSAQIFRRTAEFHQHRCFVDEFARTQAYDMDTQYPVRRRIGQNLHQSVSRLHGARPAIGGEGEFAHFVGDPGGLEFLFGLADRGDFGLRVNHARGSRHNSHGRVARQ